MTLTFKYKSTKRPDGSLVKVPSIPIRLMADGQLKTTGLIDSGADISAMSFSLADMIGVDLNKPKSRAFGIGGSVEAIETSVIVVLAKGHEKYSLRIPIKVILGQYEFPMLLGRTGFFDKFIISFNQKNEKVSLKWIGER